MQNKNLFTQVLESMKENPIKLFELKTLIIGWEFFWRQFILLIPVHFFVLYSEIISQGISDSINIIVMLIAIPYLFYSFHIAENWRQKGKLILLQNFLLSVKTGFSLWWRILFAWIRFIIPVFIILLILNFTKLNIELAAILLQYIISIPIMGFAVRHLQRTKEIAEGIYAKESSIQKEEAQIKGKQKSIIPMISLVIICIVAFVILQIRISGDSTDMTESIDEVILADEIPLVRQQLKPPPPPDSLSPDTIETLDVHLFVQEPAKFQNGDLTNFFNWIGHNLQYPEIARENGIDGSVIVSFVVDTVGQVTDVKIARGIFPSLDAEAMRVIKSSPTWTPAKHKGKLVKQQFTIPVTFVLR